MSAGKVKLSNKLMLVLRGKTVLKIFKTLDPTTCIYLSTKKMHET